MYVGILVGSGCKFVVVNQFAAFEGSIIAEIGVKTIYKAC